MIVVAGLTPAWQKILQFERLQIGEVNRASVVQWCGSGKVLNVGVALATLGVPAVTLSPLGGPAFESIDNEFAALGVDRRWVRTQSATRVCTTLLDVATHTTTELVENASALLPAELDEFASYFGQIAAKADAAVLTGSLPVDTPVTYYRDLLRHTSAPAVIDARGPELIAALEARPLVVKPNRQELGRTFGTELRNDAEVTEAIARLHQRGAQWVVMTQGRQPVWIASPAGIERVEPPAVAEVVNPIGCGDCLAAGIAWGIADGLDIRAAVKRGMAAAAENLRTILPARLNRESVLRRSRSI